MEAMIVMVLAVKAPVRTNSDPTSSRPSLLDAQAVQMPTNTLIATPEPSVGLVVVIAAVQVPIGPHALPATLHVDIQGAQAVTMHSNALKATPTPLSASVETVVVMVLAVQVPIRADTDPLCTSPSTKDTQTIQVAANTLGSAPEPSMWFVVVIALPQVPV